MSPDPQSLSDYTFLSVYIILEEKFIQDRKQTIVKNSKKKKKFVNDLKNKISDISNILNSDVLESIT